MMEVGPYLSNIIKSMTSQWTSIEAETPIGINAPLWKYFVET